MHQPVLLNEVIKYLDPKPGENFIDATVGEAGHALVILEQIKPNGEVLGIDADLEALKKLELRIKNYESGKRLILVHGNFKDLKKIAKEHNFYPVHPPKFCKAKLWRVNGILFDLGLSNKQIEEGGGGFSFKKDEPLLKTAEIIINQWSEQELFRIFKEYGEERYSRRIARAIKKALRPIKTTGQLRRIVENATPRSRSRRGQTNRVLARIFQALRIVVNDELENLRQGVEQSLEILEPKGRLVVISFHSLEDRIVKQFFKEKAKNNFLKILTKKPITASEKEISKNPRSRSAKLRAVIKR
jgi:16S rRNA (cytosine1402-N4)-methyltransferase